MQSAFPSRSLRKGENKGDKICARGLGSGTQSCLSLWFPVSPPPSSISTVLVDRANCVGKQRLSCWKLSRKHPRARRTSKFFCLVLVHQTGPLHWSSMKLCTRQKSLRRGGRAPRTSTSSSPRAGLHHLTLSPCGIGRNKPLELRASCPLISLARYLCTAHSRSNYTVQSCLIKGKPPPRALEKERNPKKCSFGSHYIFWTTSENQSSVLIPVPSLICSVTWISLFNLSIPQLLPHKMRKW